MGRGEYNTGHWGLSRICGETGAVQDFFKGEIGEKGEEE
jgi:hypothetical protein